MSNTNINIQSNADVGQTIWISNGGVDVEYLLTGHISIKSSVIAGSVRVRFTWTDPNSGAQTRDVTILAVSVGMTEFTIPVFLADSFPITYQVDRLLVVGTVSYDFDVNLNWNL